MSGDSRLEKHQQPGMSIRDLVEYKKASAQPCKETFSTLVSLSRVFAHANVFLWWSTCSVEDSPFSAYRRMAGKAKVRLLSRWSPTSTGQRNRRASRYAANGSA
ncbi:hypothetical protein TNCV_2497351 [Trichonephila clavipes]|nr:hypothetical protein TNCV_2497351 [Trichonephila clavipes]